MSWITTSPVPADFIKGAVELEQTSQGTLVHRLPAQALAQANYDAQLVMAESQPSGVRLAFRSSASTVELDTVRSTIAYSGAPAQPDGVIELVVNGVVVASSTTSGGNTTTIDMATGAITQAEGPVCTSSFTGLPEGTNSIELWLPHNEKTEVVALRTDAPVERRQQRAAGLVAPRQFHQPRLQCHAAHCHLAGGCRPPRRRGAEQHGVAGQRTS